MIENETITITENQNFYLKRELFSWTLYNRRPRVQLNLKWKILKCYIKSQNYVHKLNTSNSGIFHLWEKKNDEEDSSG